MMKKLVFVNSPLLVLFAKQDIVVGEEILHGYPLMKLWQKNIEVINLYAVYFRNNIVTT